MDLQTAYDQAEADLRRAERQLESLARRVDALRAEKQGLGLAVARHGGRGAPPSSGASVDPVAMSRTDAILRVMAEQPGILSPGRIAELLTGLGRADTKHSVGAALSYLRQQGKVHLEGRGEWVLAAPPLRPAEPPPVEDDAPEPEDPPFPEDFVNDEDTWEVSP